MQRLTQDDFVPGYSNATAGNYPKLIYWTLEAPISYNGISINANILQRKMDEDYEWEFIPSVKMSAQEIGYGDGRSYLLDLDDEDIETTLYEQKSFDDAITAIYKQVDKIRGEYSTARPRSYDAGDDDWNGWQDYGDQWDDNAAKDARQRQEEERRQRINRYQSRPNFF